jgi:hypothetical protein
MPTLQLRRLSTSSREAITPAAGEPIWDTSTEKLYIGDGSTAGGIEVSGSTSNINKYFGAVFDGGGSAIVANKKAYVRVPTACTIVAAYILADVSGTISVEVWKDTFENFPPTVADKISASAPIALSSAQSGEDTTLTGWTTSLSAGDVICFNVSALATSITWVSAGLIVE